VVSYKRGSPVSEMALTSKASRSFTLFELPPMVILSYGMLRPQGENHSGELPAEPPRLAFWIPGTGSYPAKRPCYFPISSVEGTQQQDSQAGTGTLCEKHDALAVVSRFRAGRMRSFRPRRAVVLEYVRLGAASRDAPRPCQPPT